jgi:DNA-binding transcriptional LysR family regulator
MLDPRRLRVLREVAARGSFAAAAAARSLTQSAVSQQIAALEREAGTRLVERGVRPVRLTDAGRALMVHAEAVLARLDEAQQELGEIAALARPPVRRIAAARRAASFRSAATASMLGVLKETADAFTVQDGRG